MLHTLRNLQRNGASAISLNCAPVSSGQRLGANRCATECEDMETACREKCVAMEADAKRRSEDYWTEVSTRLQAFYENHQELKKLLNVGLTIPKV